MWRRVLSYVDIHDRSAEDASLVGAEIWPSAAALCNWLRESRDQIQGSSVLELGTGTGACGLYAAGLGASSVLLTDGGPPAMKELVCGNIERNRLEIATCAVQFEQLSWGDTSHQLDGSRYDWVLASDVTYAHDAHEALAATLHALLSGAGSRPPRVVLAHEHRERDRGLQEQVDRWDEADPLLDDFLKAASQAGLATVPLWSERPVGEVRGSFCHWSADLSIFEVVLQDSRAGVL